MLEERCNIKNQRLMIVNVYAPCDLAGKKVLWDDLRQLKASNPGDMWCVLGDLGDWFIPCSLSGDSSLFPINFQNIFLGFGLCFLLWSLSLSLSLKHVGSMLLPLEEM